MLRRSAISVLMIIVILASVVPVQAGNPPDTNVSNSSVSTYIVVFNETSQPKVQAHLISDLVASYGGHVKHNYKLINGMAVTIPDDMAGQLESLPGVKYVEKEQQFHIVLNDSVPLIMADQVWAEGYTGEGVKIAVLDTGVDTTHPDLNGDKVILWKDFTLRNYTTPHDGNGHGTHVSGIIAGTGNASGGKYTGVAPNASLIEGKVLDDRGFGNNADIIAGIEWAVDNGAHVISISIGGGHSQSMDDAIARATASGVVVVVAAGNSGPNSGTIECPGDAPDAITVGAVSKSDAIASFSSRGPTGDGSVKPDVTNVGVDVVAARASGTGLGSPVNQYYTSLSGTSMATPMTSGVVALMLERAPLMTPEHVKTILEMTAEPLGSGLPNNVYGWGRVQAKYAVDNVSYSSIYESDSLPASPGTILDTTPSISITMQNDGAYNWSSDNNVTIHALGGATGIGDAITYMPAGIQIAPGQQYTWTVSLSGCIPLGTYNFSYRMFSNNTPFGDMMSKTIRVNDSVEPGTLQFTNASYTAYRTSGYVIVFVSRTDGQDNTVTVNYTTGGGNASVGVDYKATNGTLTFTPGQYLEPFPVVILNDGIYKGINKTIQISLSDPTGGASLGLSSANITLIDNNPQPVLQFSASNYIALDNRTNYMVMVKRTANSHGPVSVDYSVVGGNATPGVDYVLMNGTLNFKDGETSKSFNVTILNNHTVGQDKRVDLILSNQTNGSILGTPSSAVLIIRESTINFTFNLSSGWNLISFPILPQDTNITRLIPSDVRSQVNVVWLYNGSGVWKYWTELEGYTSTLSDIDCQHGYLVYCYSPVSFTVTGTIPESDQARIKTGDYTFVGYPRLDSTSPADQYNDTIVVWGYKNGSWYYYTPLPGYNSTLTNLDPGYGYEVYK